MFRKNRSRELLALNLQFMVSESLVLFTTRCATTKGRMHTSTTTKLSPSLPHRATSWCVGSSNILMVIFVSVRSRGLDGEGNNTGRVSEPISERTVSGVSQRNVYLETIQGAWKLTNSLALLPPPAAAATSALDMIVLECYTSGPRNRQSGQGNAVVNHQPQVSPGPA